MKISLFTCNLANASTPQNITQSIFDCQPDIHVEMTQEDYRPLNAGTVFADTVFPRDLQLIASKSLNNGPTTQNVVLRIFSKTAIQSTSGSKALGAKGKENWKFKTQQALSHTGIGLGVSKGAVWVKLNLPKPILFICMHLPMKSKSPNLGLDIRTRALHRIITEVAPLIDDNTSVFIGGDLNFRMSYDGKNQLTNELTRIPFLKELPFVTEGDKIFTCKFKSLVKESSGFFGFGKTKTINNTCRQKRLTPTPTVGNPAIVQALQQQCGVLDRIPSRCDRFLYRLATGKTIQVAYQKGGPLVPNSDHNALWACFDLVDGGSPLVNTWRSNNNNAMTNISSGNNNNNSSSLIGGRKTRRNRRR